MLAQESQVTWDPLRVSSPESIPELKAMQKRIKEITEKVMPSTVGLTVGNGAGSGVIINSEGLVLSAAHVVGKPGSKVTVWLVDGTQVKAVSLGVNDKLDSGMLKITGDVPKGAKWPGASEGKWPAVELGDSSLLKKGQWVISLGHHGGPRPDRTPPLRLGRFENFNEYDQTLRTNCTLVGGDSGGPLFDLNGKVIGIHSKIGVFLDQNMHVPANVFKKEWDKLVAGKSLGKPTAVLGASLDPDLDRPTVLSVTEGSPAEEAGMEVGDVIVQLDEFKVRRKTDLKQAMQYVKPGQKVKVQVNRGDETITLKITLGRSDEIDE
jgi:serine protease Do